MYLWFARCLKKPSEVCAGEMCRLFEHGYRRDDVFPDPMGVLLQVEYGYFQCRVFCHLL